MALTIFKPVWPDNLIRMRIKSGKAIFSPLGLEKRCNRCDQYWPADSEFFYTRPSRTDGLNDWCKACFQEWRRGIEPVKHTQDEKQCIGWKG